jgi:hypothetical protein
MGWTVSGKSINSTGYPSTRAATTAPSAMRPLRPLVFALGLAAATVASAADPVPAGRIKLVTGTVTLERAGNAVAAVPGAAVFPGDRIRTGPASSAGITLADDTLLAAGPDSSLVINQFEFDTTTHDGGFLATLAKGTLNVITGLIAKKAPEKVTIQTPTVVLGVRGTEFLVDARGAAK